MEQPNTTGVALRSRFWSRWSSGGIREYSIPSGEQWRFASLQRFAQSDDHSRPRLHSLPFRLIRWNHRWDDSPKNLRAIYLSEVIRIASAIKSDDPTLVLVIRGEIRGFIIRFLWVRNYPSQEPNFSFQRWTPSEQQSSRYGSVWESGRQWPSDAGLHYPSVRTLHITAKVRFYYDPSSWKWMFQTTGSGNTGLWRWSGCATEPCWDGRRVGKVSS